MEGAETMRCPYCHAKVPGPSFLRYLLHGRDLEGRRSMMVHYVTCPKFPGRT
jgi:hypothetical protein